MSDTIFGQATAAGRAAIAVVRCSGPDVGRTLRAIAGQAVRPRTASLRALRNGHGEILDRAVVLWFPGPASFTGEDCAELHLHGGPAVVEGVVDALLAAGLRPALPGEFTRRAFENGKLDLTQAEAVADLIDAESRAQARQAIGQMEGALGERYCGWRGALLEILGILEGGIDFADEVAGEGLADLARPALGALTADLATALAGEGRGRRVREGYRIAIIGAANAGKSSLLNHLVSRPAAIVAETPGTTRDVIECAFDIAGYRVIIADTAGMRPAEDPVEREGVRRAAAWARDADLRLLVVDGSAGESGWRE
ncbi:MAG: tRNA uridine-5-carboxymethylaminomethyl(34) synthesis GTPase MnmE, partial [Caulobacteraceae bacterium]